MQLDSFACGDPVFAAPLVEKNYPLSVELSWHPCQKPFDYIRKGLFLDSLCYSIGLFANTFCQYYTVLVTTALY